MGSSFNPIIKTTADAKDPFAGLPLGLDARVCRYFNDFLASQDYAAADWVITTTEAGAGAATEAIAAQEECGALLITNDLADADSDEFQASSDGGTTVLEAWSLTAGQKLGFSTRFKVNDADDVDAMIGLVITDTAMIDGTTDGIYFRIVEASATLELVCEKDSTETVLDMATMADDTYVEVGFHYNGAGVVTGYKRNANDDRWMKVGTITTNLPDDEQLALSFAIQNGAAAADTMTIDYLDSRQERS